jgi:hypothetical protein
MSLNSILSQGKLKGIKKLEFSDLPVKTFRGGLRAKFLNRAEIKDDFKEILGPAYKFTMIRLAPQMLEEQEPVVEPVVENEEDLVSRRKSARNSSKNANLLMKLS